LENSIEVLCKVRYPCASPITEQGLPSFKLGSKAVRNMDVMSLDNYLREAGMQTLLTRRV
jgi:hypothetical protein